MAVKEILLLGNPLLHESCRPVEQAEAAGIMSLITDLRDTLMAFRHEQGFGRAIAAPQIGAMVRVLFVQAPEPCPMLNPVLVPMDGELIDVWDDCLSFPDLLVKVRRHRRCRLTYRDLSWELHRVVVEDDLSELLQHECDHLDGILAVQRAIDTQSFARAPRRPASGMSVA